jgi:hypothetical protein
MFVSLLIKKKKVCATQTSHWYWYVSFACVAQTSHADRLVHGLLMEAGPPFQLEAIARCLVHTELSGV